MITSSDLIPLLVFSVAFVACTVTGFFAAALFCWIADRIDL